jgi:hypothetical protein
MAGETVDYEEEIKFTLEESLSPDEKKIKIEKGYFESEESFNDRILDNEKEIKKENEKIILKIKSSIQSI